VVGSYFTHSFYNVICNKSWASLFRGKKLFHP
jgi:hypothetical protein